MRIHTRTVAHAISAAPAEGDKQSFVGVLFRFGEVSANKTSVRPGAKVRAAGDAILVEHDYPLATDYAPVGRIQRFYEKDGAFLVEFTIHNKDALMMMRTGATPFLSVSWFSDDYAVREGPDGNTFLEFGDIVIYEVSLVSAPAFNTCIATEEKGLACLSPSVHLGCRCGGKCKEGSVSLGDMVAKHQEVTRDEFAALVEQVNQMQEALAALTQEVATLKQMLQQPAPEVVAELEQAKKRLEEVELTLSSQANNLSGVLAAVERLVAVTEKTYKNLPNLIRQ